MSTPQAVPAGQKPARLKEVVHRWITIRSNARWVKQHGPGITRPVLFTTLRPKGISFTTHTHNRALGRRAGV